MQSYKGEQVVEVAVTFSQENLEKKARQFCRRPLSCHQMPLTLCVAGIFRASSWAVACK